MMVFRSALLAVFFLTVAPPVSSASLPRKLDSVEDSVEESTWAPTEEGTTHLDGQWADLDRQEANFEAEQDALDLQMKMAEEELYHVDPDEYPGCLCPCRMEGSDDEESGVIMFAIASFLKEEGDMYELCVDDQTSIDYNTQKLATCDETCIYLEIEGDWAEDNVPDVEVDEEEDEEEDEEDEEGGEEDEKDEEQEVESDHDDNNGEQRL